MQNTPEKLLKARYGKEIQYETLPSFLNAVYSFEVDGEGFVVKIAEREDCWYHMLKEQRMWELMRQKCPDVPIPEIIDYNASRTIIPFPYSIARRIEGFSLKEKERMENPEQILFDLGNYLGQIHSIEYPVCGWLNEKAEIEDPVEDWAKFIEKKFHEHTEECIGFLTSSEIDKLHAYAERTRRGLEIECGSLGHGDTHFGNFLTDGKRITGVLDMELAKVGDSPNDLVRLELNLAAMPEHRDSFFLGYQEHKTLSENYPQRLEFYTFLHFVKHIAWLPNAKFLHISKEEAERKRQKSINKYIQETRELLEGVA